MANKKEKQMLLEILKALNDIPGAHIGSGGKTASIGGFVSFHKDMQEVLPHIKTVLQFVADWDLFWGSKDWAEEEAQEAIKEISEYIEKRKSEQWS